MDGTFNDFFFAISVDISIERSANVTRVIFYDDNTYCQAETFEARLQDQGDAIDREPAAFL